MSSNYNPKFPSHWVKADLYSLATWINGLAFKKISFEDSGKFPIIKINELKYGITSQTAFTNQIFDECYSLTKGDLLFSWSGSPETSIDAFWYQLKNGLLNQHIFKVLPKEQVSKEFIYYLLKYIKPEIIRIAKDKQTTGLGHITKSDMKQLIVSYPSLKEQQRLVNIIKSIDDKIELNRQTAQTLEAIAQALFKEWFVEFNFPGATGEMEESELGMIPTGWRVKELGEIYKTTSGGTPSRSKLEYFENGVIPWVKSKELNNTFIISTEEHITEEALKKSSAKLLPKHSVLIAMYGATVGEVGIISMEAACNQAICAFLPNDHYPYTFVYQYLLNNKTEIISRAVGSAQQNISQELLKRIKLIVPPLEILSRFNQGVNTLYESLESMICENVQLEELRSQLLPRLMKGEIPINLHI